MTKKVTLRTQGQSTRRDIADAGTTRHFMMLGTPVINIKPITNLIQITLPNGQKIASTHTCNLNIPWLPAHMAEAYMMAGMAHSLLISIKIFATVDTRSYMTKRRRKYITRRRNKSTGLRLLPIAKKDAGRQEENIMYATLDLQLLRTQSATNITHMTAILVYTLPYKQQQMKYMHQRIYNMPIPTLIKAIQNNQLTGFPCMTTTNVKKYLALLPPKPKSRMKQPRAGIRSTKKQH